MTDFIIREMTMQDLRDLNAFNVIKLPYYVPRESGWKVLIDGSWHFGFRSLEDAEWALSN